jgi:hypothetical protein
VFTVFPNSLWVVPGFDLGNPVNELNSDHATTAGDTVDDEAPGQDENEG